MTKSLLFIMCKLCFHHYFPLQLSPFHYLFRRWKRTFLSFQVAPWFSLQLASTLETIQQFKWGKLCLFALVLNPQNPDGEPWQIRAAAVPHLYLHMFLPGQFLLYSFVSKHIIKTGRSHTFKMTNWLFSCVCCVSWLEVFHYICKLPDKEKWWSLGNYF